MERSLIKAYQERLETEATNVVLGKYGLTMKEFISTGLERFGELSFTRLMAEIKQVKLGLSFLAAGYDANGGPHIFSVSHPGNAKNHDVTGFWAIGSGQYGALASLFFHSYNKKFLPPEALYHVCEAKFMAERSGGVGEASSVLVLSLDPGYAGTAPAKIRVEELLKVPDLKKIWNKEGKPRVPKNLYQRMKDLLEIKGTTQEAFLGFRRN